MDTESSVDLLDMFQLAETKISYISSTLHLISNTNVSENTHVTVVTGRLEQDVQSIKKIMRDIKRAAFATPNNVTALKTGT